jgi:PIN domain nuclease of toxin-antitoxin system
MNVIVDTEVLIWIQTGEGETSISSMARQHLLNNQWVKWISEVSLFEITIKQKIGKLRQFDTTLVNYIQKVQDDGFRLLPISRNHIVAYDQLPLHQDHRDPFDWLILATALHEGWPVMPVDSKFGWYKDQIGVIW